MTPKSFALVGAAGYIAPRHMKAIKETGNILRAAIDPYDGVGIIDSYFPETTFFTQIERFDRYIDKQRRQGDPIDYLTICSPNYLHDAHIRLGLRSRMDVICEKPIVLNPWNIEALIDLEKEFEKKVYAILQLRLHPAIKELKNKIENGPRDKIYDIDLVYLTSRGNWYYTSWKGDESKSGGVATNIGVHFFDMLTWIFGPVKQNIVHVHSHDRCAGFMELEKARVRWFLSIDVNTIPENVRNSGKRTYRRLIIEDNELEFSEGFTDLHTQSYRGILSGEGFSIIHARPSIQIVHDIRQATPVGLIGDYHPFAKLPQGKHPFE
jgi:UDP-N-acetyl-2-amino-2-deoxyglucuronate dehydrogenase